MRDRYLANPTAWRTASGPEYQIGPRRCESARFWTRIQGADAQRTIRQKYKSTAATSTAGSRNVVTAQRVLCESRKLLEQREVQFKQLEPLLEQNPEIAHEKLGNQRE